MTFFFNPSFYMDFASDPHRIFFRDTIKKIVFRQPIFLIVSRLVLEGGVAIFLIGFKHYVAAYRLLSVSAGGSAPRTPPLGS